MKAIAIVSYGVVRVAVVNRASFADTIELAALATLAIVRYGTPTGPMILGQLRAKVRRIQMRK